MIHYQRAQQDTLGLPVNSAISHCYLCQLPMDKTTLAVGFHCSPHGEHPAVGPGALWSSYPSVVSPMCLSPSSLTILQGRDRLCLRAEVAVPDVVGGLHSQFVRGERVQAVEWGKQS